MYYNNYPKKMLAVLFGCFLLVLLLYKANQAAEIFTWRNDWGVSQKKGSREKDGTGPESSSVGSEEAGEENSGEKKEPMQETSPLEDAMLSFHDTLQSRLDMRGFYYDLHMFLTEDKYIVKTYPETTTDYEFNQVMKLKEFLDKEGIHFAYINEPTKYLDDTYVTEMFGVYTYTNQNADRLCSRLKKAGVHTLDLREEIVKDKLNIFDMFYRTDHHWTTRAGLWASGKIARTLNEWCGYSIDLTLFDEDKYVFTTYEDSWIGEQGLKIGASTVGPDDFTLIHPKEKGRYIFYGEDGPWEDSFMGFINEKALEYNGPIEKRSSLHYVYLRQRAVNENVEKGKVLIIGDSFSHVTEPFLSQGVHEINAIVLRGLGDSFELKKYILDGGYDTVLICYVQTNIGTYEDPKDPNSKMFWLDR